MSKRNAHFQLENLILKYFPWAPLTHSEKSSSGSAIFFTKHYARSGLAGSKAGAPACASAGPIRAWPLGAPERPSPEGSSGELLSI